MRTLFGEPIRKSTTGGMHPDKINIEEFVSEVEGNLEPFKQNLRKIRLNDKDYIEVWFETFLSWMEVENEVHR